MINIKKTGSMNADVRLFLSDKLKPDQSTINRLIEMSKVRGIVEAVAGMPDLHYKFGRPVPTGIVVPTKDRVIPDFLVASCGMSFVNTNINTKDIDDEVFG